MRGRVALVLVAASCVVSAPERAIWQRGARAEQAEVTGAPRGARVVDPASHVGLRFELTSPGEMTIVEKASGVEDHVRVEDARTSITYALTLEGDARLREVANVIELLDRDGTPRVRVTAPFVTDARGEAHPARLALEGCAADHDPRPPWGRPTVPPGALACVARVSWEAGLALPIVVDPGWTSTQSLSVPRNTHTMTVLTDGRVLVAGGVALFGGMPHASAEVFDPTTRTFAATGSMNNERVSHAATRLTSGQVLVCGGFRSNFVKTNTCELWDPKSGSFTAAGAMNQARTSFILVSLPSGNALVAGGFSATFEDTAEEYDASTKTFGSLVAIDDYGVNEQPARANASGIALPDGDVLIAGGSNYNNTDESRAFKACRLYRNGAFHPTGSLHHSLLVPMLFPLPNGDVWVAGGFDRTTNLASDKVEIYDVKAKSFTEKKPLLAPRYTEARPSLQRAPPRARRPHRLREQGQARRPFTRGERQSRRQRARLGPRARRVPPHDDPGRVGLQPGRFERWATRGRGV